MEIISILMFYGLIWSDILPIRCTFNNIWPNLRVLPYYYCFCASDYRSVFYFPFFVVGFIFIFGAMTNLILQSLTRYIFRLTAIKETMNEIIGENIHYNERRLEEIEKYYERLATNNNYVIRRILMIFIFNSTIILTFIIFVEYILILIPPPPQLSYINNTELYWAIIHLLLIITILLETSFIVLLYKEYWEYITYRHPSINKGYQMLK